MMHRRKFSGLVSAAALVAGTVGWGRPAAAQALDKLRIVVVPTEIPVSMINAGAMGYFKDAGLDAEVIALSNGAAATAAVLSGSADVAFSNTMSLIVAHDKGLPVRIVVGTDLHRSTNPVQGILAVLKSSPLRTGKDFNGKTLAVTAIGSTQYYATRKWVDVTGGDSKTLRFVEMTIAAAAPAIIAGRVDGSTLDVLTLNAVEARSELREAANVYNAVAPVFLSGAFFATADWIEQHPDAARKFIGVYQRYAAWANSHPADEIRFYAKQSGFSPEALGAVPRAKFEPTLTLDSLQPVIDLAARYGAIATPFRAADLLGRTHT
jgi:NitT/TauT family transport system substrate-binding protein